MYTTCMWLKYRIYGVQRYSVNQSKTFQSYFVLKLLYRFYKKRYFLVFVIDAQYLSFELTDGSVLTSPSLATSGVISSLSDTSLITCCMKCTRIGQCAGIFYDSDSTRCKHYSFQNYTSMNIAGVQNFVKVIPGII